MRDIHVSKVISFRNCPRRFYWADEDVGWGYGLYEFSPPMVLGTLVHRALEAYYTRGEELTTALQQAADQELLRRVGVLSSTQLEEFNDIVARAEGILRGYLVWVAENGVDDSWEFLQLESEFAVPVEDGLVLSGRWDGVVRSRDGGLYIMEHKTTSDVARTVRGLVCDLQPYVYAWAAERILGERPQGVLYNLLNTNNPYNIPILRNGLPSRGVRSRMQTSYETYRDFLISRAKAVGMDVSSVLESYRDELEYLRENPTRFYYRTILRMGDVIVNNTVRQVLETGREMLRVLDRAESGEMPIPYRDRFKCTSCLFMNACVLVDCGANPKEVLETTIEGGIYIHESQ